MYNAKTARELAKDIQEKVALEARRKEKQEAEERVLFEKTLIPKYKRKLEQAINEAVKNGLTGVTFSMDSMEVVKTALEEWLTVLGYRYRVEYHEGDVNHGDFNAPCVIHETWYRFEISW